MIRVIPICLLYALSSEAIADGGLGGLSIVIDTFFWVSVVLFFILIVLVVIKNLRKKSDKKKHNTFTIIILVLYLPIYLVLLPADMLVFSSSARSYNFWLLLLHITLSALVIYYYLDKVKSKIMLCVVSILLFVLSTFLSPDINLYKFKLVENQVLSKPQSVLVDYGNKIIELSNGLYQKHGMDSQLRTGDFIELRKENNEIRVFKQVVKHSKVKGFLINLPLIEKEYNQYTVRALPGYLVKLDRNRKFEVPFDALLKYNCNELSCSLQEMKSLVHRGANVNAMEDSYTPLHKVSFAGTVEHVMFLLEQGAKVEGFSKNNNPLLYALRNELSGVAIIELLIQNGAKVDALFLKELSDLPQSIRKKEIFKIIENPNVENQ